MVYLYWRTYRHSMKSYAYTCLYWITQETLASQCVSFTSTISYIKYQSLGDSVSLRGTTSARGLVFLPFFHFSSFFLSISFFFWHRRIRRKSSKSSRQTRSSNTMLIDQNPITAYAMKPKASCCSRLLTEKAFAKHAQPRLVNFIKESSFNALFLRIFYSQIRFLKIFALSFFN